MASEAHGTKVAAGCPVLGQGCMRALGGAQGASPAGRRLFSLLPAALWRLGVCWGRGCGQDWCLGCSQVGHTSQGAGITAAGAPSASGILGAPEAGGPEGRGVIRGLG